MWEDGWFILILICMDSTTPAKKIKENSTILIKENSTICVVT